VNEGSINALADLAMARMDLSALIKRIQDQGIAADQKAELLKWIPKARKIVEEIDLMCQTKVPSVDDAINEMLTYGEWNPNKSYVVTHKQQPHEPDELRRLPMVRSGDQVKEDLETMEGYFAENYISHIYLLEDDGTLTHVWPT
jgi:hypothetical protein